MLESNSSARIVMTTVVSPEEGTRLGRTLVEERLAACATLLPPVHSIYRWQGESSGCAWPTEFFSLRAEGTTQKRQLQKGLEALDQKKLLGALLNGAVASTYSGYYDRSSVSS